MAKKNTWKIAYRNLSFKTKAAREMYRARLFLNQDEANDWLFGQNDKLNVTYNGEASWSEHRSFRTALRAI